MAIQTMFVFVVDIHVDGRIPPVAKARLATEELYKLAMADRRRPSGDK